MITQRRILIISALDFWSMGKDKGGSALSQTLRGYADRGWDVYFITGNRAQSDNGEPNPNIHVIRFDALWLKKLIRLRKIGFFAKILWWIYFQVAAFIKRQQLNIRRKIDVVYGYEIFAVPVAKVLSKLFHVPVVSRFQGTILVKAMKLSFWRVRMWEHVLGLSMPANLAIMTNDGTQGDHVLQKLGVNMDQVKFWINGVDLKYFNEMPEKLEAKKILNVNDKNVLVTVSRLVAWKHVERSICALPEVVRMFPSSVLVIIGDGPERGKLKRLTYELKVDQHVRFESAVPHQEIPKYLAAADIFLSFYDLSNVGNPLLEAMISGKCIITLNNGDTSRFIQNGNNGILLEYEDLPRVPQVTKQLLADEKRRKKLGSNARKFAKEHFWTWEERMDAEVQAVEMLLR